ncbi:hypothetical protein BGY98DRAFT_933042 [Russula aff. rugulosa BPL654]|nr:hypothetical protein BGY98DRAFT_933042 [Russula aff. rugulosa BPL654]
MAQMTPCFLYLTCESCRATSALEILQEQTPNFNQYRNRDWKVQLMRWLRPTVDIPLEPSSRGDLGGIPPARSIFIGIGLLLAAAKGVSTSYDALIGLFECFERCLSCLNVLTEIPSTVGEILAKIMVGLLEVLALAAQQLKQGHFNEFMLHIAEKLAKKLPGKKDIEAVLQRLGRLTMEESRMAATQSMEVIYGLFNNMKVVMSGTEVLPDITFDGKSSIDNIREALGMRTCICK